MLEYTSVWAQGDSFQGKLMLVAGLITLIGFVFILRGDDALYRGALIPISLILLILLGYGSSLVYSRPIHLQEIRQLYEKSPKIAKAKELEKANTDHRNYSMLLKIWPVLIILSAISFYFATTDYYKGLSIGLIALFLTGLLLDTALHHRLLPYWEYLQN